MKRIMFLLAMAMLFVPSICGESSAFAKVTSNVVLRTFFPDKKTEIEANMRQARHYMEKGDYVSAKKKLERVLELDKDHAEALNLMVECNRKIDFESWDEARKTNTKAAYQHYLSTSNILAYKKDAEAAIRKIEEQEALELKYERNLSQARQYYMQNQRSLALSYYEEANAFRALTGEHLIRYNDLVTEARYIELKESNNLSELQDFLNRLSTDSPYYHPISNRIALIRAERLTVDSSEEEMDLALSYAMDEETRSTVNEYISDIKQRQRKIERDLRRSQRKLWWKDRVSFGWCMIMADLDLANDNPSTCSLGTGLRLRFGRYDDLINISLGINYQHFMRIDVTTTTVPYYGYEEECYDYIALNNRLTFPVNLRFNAPIEELGVSLYAGCSAEVGAEVDDFVDYFADIECLEDLYYLYWTGDYPSFAIEPQIGFQTKHFDLGFYYRYYLDGYSFFDSSYEEGNNRMGFYMTIFF